MIRSRGLRLRSRRGSRQRRRRRRGQQPLGPVRQVLGRHQGVLGARQGRVRHAVGEAGAGPGGEPAAARQPDQGPVRRDRAPQRGRGRGAGGADAGREEADGGGGGDAPQMLFFMNLQTFGM